MKALSATVKILEDPETGDLVLPIPDDWLNELGWRVGDKLRWRKRATGDWKLTNQTKAKRDKAAPTNPGAQTSSAVKTLSNSRLHRLNRRQRKKLRVGEFQELVFEVSVSFKTALALADWDLFMDDLCEYVDSQGLGLCGFGGRMPLAATDGWIQKRGRGSPTQTQCKALIAWLAQRPEVKEASPGAWVDAWHGAEDD